MIDSDRLSAHSAGASDPTGATSVEGNARLTALVGIVLLVLLAAEGVTILSIRRLLPVHFFIGVLVIPPVLLKLGSTGWRFARYYIGDPGYRRAGPPPLLLRLTGPIAIASTIAVLATGVELWLFGDRYGMGWLTVHKASFVIWFGAMAIHVLGHLERTPTLALRDFFNRPRIRGRVTRQAVTAGSVLMGLVLALATLFVQSPFVTPVDH